MGKSLQGKTGRKIREIAFVLRTLISLHTTSPILCWLDILMVVCFHDWLEVCVDASVRFFLEFVWILLAPLLDDGVVDVLKFAIWDESLFELLVCSCCHLFNVFIFVDAVFIVLAVSVTDLSGVLFVSVGEFHFVLSSGLGLCPRLICVRMWMVCRPLWAWVFCTGVNIDCWCLGCVKVGI